MVLMWWMDSWIMKFTYCHNVSIMYMPNKCFRISDVSNIYLWHYRLGHINKNKINKLTQERIFKISDCESLLTCESCLFEKMTKSSFIEKSEWVSEVLGLIHTNIYGFMNMSVRGGYYYFIIFIDNLSRYGYVYLMTHKLESFQIFKWFCNEIEK